MSSEAPYGDPRSIKPFVIVESPYAGDIERNVDYARAAIRDCILRGEAPFASHLLYTQSGILRDEVPSERELGMTAGWHVMRRANLVAIYTDLGWSSGMKRGLDAAMAAGKPFIERSLGPSWLESYEAIRGQRRSYEASRGL